MSQDHFLQAAARITRGVRDRHSASPAAGGKFRFPPALHRGAVTGAPLRPKMPSPGVTLLGPFVTPPSPDLPVATRWLLTSVEAAECGQGVLYGSGPAQVGFGVGLSSFHRLTLSSKGKLSPEPLRLTRPEGAYNGFCFAQTRGFAPGYCSAPFQGGRRAAVRRIAESR